MSTLAGIAVILLVALIAGILVYLWWRKLLSKPGPKDES